jgi:hypothetical protein
MVVKHAEERFRSIDSVKSLRMRQKYRRLPRDESARQAAVSGTVG